jgi:hypothetical protein
MLWIRNVVMEYETFSAAAVGSLMIYVSYENYLLFEAKKIVASQLSCYLICCDTTTLLIAV